MTKPAFSDDKPPDDLTVSRNLSNVLVILILGLLVILSVWALQPEKQSVDGDADGVTHPAVGQPMGSFQLTPLVGDTHPVTLESLRGEVVLLNFWGTWCPPCMMEFPHLVEMNDRLKSDQRFRFVPVACGPGGSEVPAEELRTETEAYVAKLETKLDVYSDPGAGARMSIVKSAQLSGFGYPTTVLLDRDGTIQGLWKGYAPGLESEMEKAINALLKS